jgi:hypothetical protein
MAAKRKSRLRVFPSDLIIAFWVGFFTCLAIVLFVIWAVNRNA